MPGEKPKRKRRVKALVTRRGALSPARGPRAPALAVVQAGSTELRRGKPAERLLRAFLAGKRETTLRAYRRDLVDFRDFVGGLLRPEPRATGLEAAVERLLGLGPGPANELVMEYKAHLMERKLAPATINRRLAALRSMMKLGRTLGMVNWTLEVPNVSSQSYRDMSGPTDAEFRKMLAAVKGRGPKAKRDRAILRLLNDLALRRAELVSLDVEHVFLDLIPTGRLKAAGPGTPTDESRGATVSVLRKGRSQREILSLPRETQAALRKWLRMHPAGKGALFRNFARARKGDGRLTGTAIFQIVHGYGLRVGLKNMSPHRLRHGAITKAVREAQAHGIGIEKVLHFSGHKNLATLLKYVDNLRNMQGQIAQLVAATAPGRKRASGAPRRGVGGKRGPILKTGSA